MPVSVSYPGVYVEELPQWRPHDRRRSDIDHRVCRQGDTRARQRPVTVTSFGDFERAFGGLHVSLPLGYAVRDFFLNGGAQAVVVRLYKKPAAAAGTATLEIAELTLQPHRPERGACSSGHASTRGRPTIRTSLPLRSGSVCRPPTCSTSRSAMASPAPSRASQPDHEGERAARRPRARQRVPVAARRDSVTLPTAASPTKHGGARHRRRRLDRRAKSTGRRRMPRRPAATAIRSNGRVQRQRRDQDRALRAREGRPVQPALHRRRRPRRRRARPTVYQAALSYCADAARHAASSTPTRRGRAPADATETGVAGLGL